MDDRKLIIIAYTETGKSLGEQVQSQMTSDRAVLYVPERMQSEFARTLPGDTRSWMKDHWGKVDFLFICATGIAVRMIAPCVEDKYTDSAVVAMDELGQHVIPLLSSHVGGGMDLAREIADISGGELVITTATDVHEKFAVDVYSKNHKLIITDRQKAKEISAGILEGKKVGFYVEDDLKDLYEIPDGVEACLLPEDLMKYEYGVLVVSSMKGMKDYASGDTRLLILLPRNIILGIGCKKNTPKEVLEEGICTSLEEHGLVREQIKEIVSIDLKKEEPGILELCDDWKISFETYRAEELLTTGEVENPSEFVQKVTGVDNVCERAVRKYMMEKGSGHVIQKKKAFSGMTVAIGKE